MNVIKVSPSLTKKNVQTVCPATHLLTFKVGDEHWTPRWT